MKQRQFHRFFVPSIGLLCISGGSALGQTTFSSTNATASWFDPSNWSAGIPNGSIDALLDTSNIIYLGDYSTGSSIINGGAGSAQNLNLNFGGTSNFTLDMGSNFTGGKSGSLTITQNLGIVSPLTLQNGVVTAGSVTGNYMSIYSRLSVGNATGGNATLNVLGNFSGIATVQHGSTMSAGSLGVYTLNGFADVLNYGAYNMSGNQNFTYGTVQTFDGGKTNFGGNLALSGNNSIWATGGATHVSGNLTANEGEIDYQGDSTLKVDGKTSLTAGSNIIASNATFTQGLYTYGGDSTIYGTINGNVHFLNQSTTTNDGTVALGLAPTTINGNLENATDLTIYKGSAGTSAGVSTKINGNLTLDPTSQLVIDMGGTPDTWAPIQVSGTTKLGGALGITDTAPGTYTVDLLHSSGVISGMFDMNLRQDYTDIRSITYGQHDVYVTFTGTPEPAPAAFLGLGIGFLALHRRRKASTVKN